MPRLVAPVLLLLPLLCVAAQGAPVDAPPPPAMPAVDAESEAPDVVIMTRPDATVAEYRYHGKVYMQKVTPVIGPPYYLIDERGDGRMIRKDPADTGLRVPQWLIKQF